MRTHRLIGALVLVVFAVLVIRCAWVSDDAFITLRTVRHALGGYGLRWNVAERVQSYTHPLWMFLLLATHEIAREPYFGTLVLSGVVSLGSVAALWFGVARSTPAALAATVPLLWSKAFVDYSTSGLENPLTHLLLAAVLMSLLKGGERPVDLFRTALVVALAMLTRLDLVLLFGPALVAHAWQVPRTRNHLWAALLGFTPLFAWELFAFVYYGSLVPNTAYAKLGNGIARSELVWQGLTYLAHAATYDRITVLVMACAVIPLVKLHSRPVVALVSGAALYLAYTVWVGGDFMAGRFLTPPLFAASLAFSRLELRWPVAGGAVGIASLAGALSPYAPPWSGEAYTKIPAWSGIVDERGYYHRGAGFWSTRPPLTHAFAREGRKARRKGRHTVFRAAVGYFGYYAGPKVHIVDPLGLNDPLLARIPARYNPTWRVGHYRREIPRGYDPGNDTPPNDPALAALHADTRALARGPLSSPARLATAARLQLFGSGLEPWPYQFPDIRPKLENEPSILGPVPAKGVVVHVSPARSVAPGLTLDDGQVARVLYAHQERIVATHDLVGTGELVRLPASHGPIDLVFVFQRNKGRPVQVREFELGPG